MFGFFGRWISINLSNQTYEIASLPDDILAQYLGGKGLASYLLSKYNPKGVDPLSAENCIVFATGPVTNSLIWGSSRYGVYTKSPQTGFYAESYAGGRVPEAIDSAGYDAILIHGGAKRPIVLVVHPEGVEFHCAKDLWGLDTIESEDAVNARYGLKRRPEHKSGAVVIGPAGENRVRFAVVENDHWRSAGRTGIGAVMGAKKLKAIAFQGNRRRPLYDPDGLKTFSSDFCQAAKSNPSIRLFRAQGTPKMVAAINKARAFPTRYWSENYLPDWEKLTAETLNASCDVSPVACSKCLIGCGRQTTIRNGRHAGLRIGGPEYETIFAFGGLCLVDSLEEIIYLNDICDRLGMDTISAGNLCGLAIEAARRGKIDIGIDYADVDGIANLLRMIAGREGVGDTLARGIRFTSKQWGLEDLAVHAKGLEPPGYDPRVLKGSGLGYAVSSRGACHLRATFHRPELNGQVDPDVIGGKALHLIDYEDRLVLMDVLILCRFYRDLYPWEKLARIFELTTGISMDKAALSKCASDIVSLVRTFNVREGLTRNDDHLSERLYREATQSGHRLKRSDLTTMVQEYYALRGWSDVGNPL
ncbi:MAG: aldehyde ferredoxin oxidoreductase family protein [Deltaproteobacteria bacterium]|nr:aldehyde ferredoxin oxidoreductase family protein [Deltaproteobacteria bacterium]